METRDGDWSRVFVVVVYEVQVQGSLQFKRRKTEYVQGALYRRCLYY